MMKRLTAMLVALAMVISLMPSTMIRALAEEGTAGTGGTAANSVVADLVADVGTAHTWETMMGTAHDGNRYAGRLWADKSVFTDGQTALLDSKGSAYQVELNQDEAFQIIFSVMGSSMTTTTTNSYVGPMDVVLVLDTSTSMAWDADGQTRLERTVTAANGLLEDLLKIPNLRLSIVTYNADSETVLELDHYTNGVVLSTNSYTNTNGGGIISAHDNDGNLLGNDSGYTRGTNLQAGIDRGFQILANAENVSGRVPVAIVLTDGEANRAVRNNWYNVPAGTVGSSGETGIALSTLLNAAYGKVCIEKNYGKAPMVYGIGVELSEGGLGRALMDPGNAENGFNSNNSSSSVRSAYSLFQRWANGETVTSGNNNNRWTFDHGMPSNPGVTTAEVVANINYVDTYYSVNSADLGITFTEIYEELSSSVFNPITSTQTATGGTGVKDTPLVFVDTIGQYMEIKRIQNVTLFGSTYAVVQNQDGTYTVTEATGVNPTTQENYNTAEDIVITVTENADGTQTLRIEIDQEILPILLEKVLSETENGATNVTIEEVIQQPLRVYYTVGLSESILTDGQVDVSKLAEGYVHMDAQSGKIHFYSNAFGNVNTADTDGDGFVDMGDAHIGFKPSAANRYYYHQANVGIFSSVEATDGTAIFWDASEYGVLYEEGQYDLTYLSYEDYQTLQDSELVYTYVNYYRPTVDASDAANAAEKVTYLVYTEWGYLKESVAFYDRTANVYVNYDAANGYTTANEGYAIPMDQVAATIEAYIRANPDAEMQAVLGIGSLRTSRLHNMLVAKESNPTGTAELRYDPEYTHDTAAEHSGNDVVVWLGNNGRLSVDWNPDLEITIEKIWDDANNQDGLRPDTLTVHLTAINTKGEITTQTIVLSASDNWTKTLTVPMRDADGYTLTYSLTEDAVAGYSGSISQTAGEGTISFTIENTHIPLETSVTVLKRWDDADNQDGIRPESIKVELYANGSPTGKVVVLNAENNWTYTWQNLPKNASGEEIAYTVVEQDVPDGYVSDVLSDEYVGLLEIVNTHEPEKTQVSVNKVWNDNDDQDGIRPGTVEVELYADGMPTGKRLTLDASNNWKGTFTDLDKFSNGTAVIYTVREVSVPTGYNVAITGSATDGFTLTNTHQVEKTDITVSKIWNDADNQDGKRPASITVNLFANGEKIATQTLDASMNWTYTWTGLNKNENGQEIVYTVDEIAIDGYTTTIDGLVITNTHEVEKTTMSVSKVWNDANNQDGKRPASVTVHLLADGEHTGQTVVLSDANGWEHTWTDLDLYAAGKVINYTVYEEAVAGYTTTYARDSADDSHVIITNTYSPEKTAVTVQKLWNDNHDQDGIRPNSIEVELYANNQPTGKKLTITETEHWKGTFTNLDKYANGELIRYTVKETPIEGYTTTVSVDELTGIVTVTNTHVPETVDVTVNKVWVDNNDQDGIRPNGVVLELYADGIATGKTVTVSAGSDWKGIFKDMPKYSYGTEVVYTVQEVDVPAGYTATASGTTVTNTHIPETLSITVSKVWVDNNNQDGLRPESITVNLYADGVLVATAEMTPENLGIVTFANLPKYADGEEIVYTVEEANVPSGYTESYSGSVEDGFVITNTHQVSKIQISASKVWDDNNDQDGKRPASVTVHLLANGEHTGLKVFLSEENGWTYTWTDLDEYHNGTKIIYTVYEEPVEGYTTSYTREPGNNTHVIITNRYTPEKTGLTVQKVWMDNDNQDGIRPNSVEVELYANGKATGTKVTLNAANNWRYSFTGLDKFAGGEEIAYTVVELTKVSGYEVSYKLDSEAGLYEIINTHAPEKLDIPVIKVWNDADDQDGLRPDNVVVELYANGMPTGKKLTLKASNNWKGAFTELDKYVGGTAVVYTVREVSVPTGYTAAITGSMADGFTVTNTHQVEKTSITVIKVWNDANDQDGKRPATITVNLFANGEKIATQTLDVSVNWSYTWTNLDKYADGEEIEYTVTEDAVDGYTTTVNGLIITNTYKVEKTSLSVSKVWNDANDQDGKRPESITVHLLADGEHTGLTQVLSEENGWSATWTGLDKYAEGELINYTVYEVPVDGYYTTYTRDSADDNHVIITNTYSVEKTSFVVLKVWHDGHNRDGLRKEVVVELYANGQPTGITATLRQSNHWTYTFTDLDKMSNGEPIVYTAVEITELPGYTVSYRTDEHTGIFEIVNTHTPATTQISVSKVWDDNDDQDGIRPDTIEVILLANGLDTGVKIILNEANNWSAVITDLPVYEHGVAIVYAVQEKNVPGYTCTVSQNGNNFVITNTHTTEVVDIPVEKVWEDNNNQDGKRPGSVTIALLANGVDTGARIELNSGNAWSGVFEDLPVNSNGSAIVYTFQEVDVPAGYTVRYEGNTVINTYSPQITSIRVNKVWDDNNDQDGIRPDSIAVSLLANGEPTGMTAVLTAANGWTYEWTGLPVYSNGTLLSYTVVETPTEGYVAEYTVEGNTITITNRHVTETVNVSASKYWDDENNRDGIRPDKVVFVLVANGVPTDKTIELNEQNNWYGEWTNLPKNENGTPIVYTVMEIDITQGYVSIVDPNTENPYDFTVTNRYAPMKTSLTAEKLWADNDNAQNTRPESIVVALLANGVIVDEVELNESNGWTYTWTDLYQYENGELIVYTVQEITADENYTVSYSSDMGQHGEMLWQITNTLVESTPDTGDTIQPVFLMMIFSLAGVLVLVPAARKKEQEAAE